MTSSLRRTSSSERRFNLFEIGIQKMFAVMTPHNVAVKALAIAGPSVPGEDRSPNTLTRPMTVPRMPIVGANPPMSAKNLMPTRCRARMPTISASSTLRTRSGSESW